MCLSNVMEISITSLDAFQSVLIESSFYQMV